MRTFELSIACLCVTIGACLIDSPSRGADSALEDARAFVLDKVHAVEERYRATTYWCYHELRDESGTLSETRQVQYARTRGPLFVRGFEFMDAASHQFGELNAVPERTIGELSSLSLRNTVYDATIRERSGQYVVADLRENQRPVPARDTNALYAYGMPWFGRSFQEIIEIPEFQFKEWKSGQDACHLTFALTAPVAPDAPNGGVDNYDIEAVFDASTGRCLATTLSASIGGYNTTTVRTYEPSGFLHEVTKVGRAKGEPHAVTEHFLFREDVTIAPLTDEECMLSYYGLPEPSFGVRRSPHFFRWIAILVLIALASVIAVARRVQKK